MLLNRRVSIYKPLLPYNAGQIQTLLNSLHIYKDTLEYIYFPSVLQLSLNQTMAYFFPLCMLKLELLALATKSCNFYSCQKRFSSCITDQVCCSYGKSLIRKLYYWQKVKSTLPRVCKEESHRKRAVKRQRVLLSASQFRNSQKLPRCQPISSHSYEEQAQHLLFLIIPLVARAVSKVQGLHRVVSAGVVNVSFKKGAQSPISLNGVEKSTAETLFLRNPDLCHPRDFWEQDIL